MKCEDEKILEDSSTLLVKLHLKFHHKIDREAQLEWRNQFIDKCTTILRTGSTPEKNRAVSLILKFINLFEDRETDEEESSINTHTVRVKHNGLNEIKSFQMTYHSTMRNLRNEICKAWKIGNHTFQLSTDEYMYPLNHSQSIRDLGYNSNYFVDLKDTFESENHPMDKLAENNQFFA